MALITALTATQIIYFGMQGLTGEYQPEAVCRICGGPLFLPSKPLKNISNSWTDENLCRRLDSNKICCACAWFTEGKNHTRIWNANPFLYASQETVSTLSIPDLFNLLKTGFATPSVLMIRGRDINLIRKHIQWRALDSVTYDMENTKVMFYGLQLWMEKTGQVIGTAIFSTPEMVKTVEIMIKKAQPYINSVIANTKKKKLSEWFIQNLAMENLMSALMDVMTPSLFLAAYIASHVLAKEVIDRAKN